MPVDSSRPPRPVRFHALPWCVAVSIVATGCGAAAEKNLTRPGYPAASPASTPGPELRSQPVVGGSVDESAPREVPPSAQRPEGLLAGAPVPSPSPEPRPPQGDDAELTLAKRMVDIEAHLRIEVQRVPEAAVRLRELVNRSEGRIASETTVEDTPSTARAEFTLRVPIVKADDVFRGIDTLGVTRSRDVRARDIGKEYYDSVLRLRNLQVTRERLEQVLKQASAVKDILAVETELTRIRGETEQIEGQLRYMKDRAAFATIFVTLFVRPPVEPQGEVIVKPEAQFFPGLHAGYLFDIRGNASTASYYGGGLGVGISRRFDLELDGFRRFDHVEGALDAFTATLGGRFYSEYMGGGTRRFLDPYLGLRGGYARFERRNELVTGITLGLELMKTETVRIDLGVPALVLFGTRAGAHAAFAPTLGVDVAF